MINGIITVLESGGGPASPLRGSISGIMGSTSLACWVVLLMPQLIEQWRLKSSDGIAIGFISIWFLGDIFNLIGSIWAKLLPQVVFLAIWFCFTDSITIFSYVYYKHFYKKHHPQDHNHEQRPLINRRRTSSTLTAIALGPSYNGIFINYILPILFVIGCGILGYFVSPGRKMDIPDNLDNNSGQVEIMLGPQLVGYLSALLYLGARIPQIIQNHHRKSVQGLSLLFFLFSVLGNITYAGQILIYRNDKDYIFLNLSWLLGSLGTIFEDIFILVQFHMYKERPNTNDVEEFLP